MEDIIAELNAMHLQYARRVEAYYQAGILDITRLPVDNVNDFAWWSYGVECGLMKVLKMLREAQGQELLEEK